jgi:hypothetical protein
VAPAAVVANSAIYVCAHCWVHATLWFFSYTCKHPNIITHEVKGPGGSRRALRARSVYRGESRAALADQEGHIIMEQGVLGVLEMVHCANPTLVQNGQTVM